jgi:hypothetical protein
MSRSYRKTYFYFAAGSSVKVDRQRAARLYRRLESRSLRGLLRCNDLEAYVHPVPYEAAGNDRWTWRCDTEGAYLMKVDRRDLTHAGLGDTHQIDHVLQLIREYSRK